MDIKTGNQRVSISNNTTILSNKARNELFDPMLAKKDIQVDLLTSTDGKIVSSGDWTHHCAITDVKQINQVHKARRSGTIDDRDDEHSLSDVKCTEAIDIVIGKDAIVKPNTVVTDGAVHAHVKIVDMKALVIGEITKGDFQFKNSKEHVEKKDYDLPKELVTDQLTSGMSHEASSLTIATKAIDGYTAKNKVMQAANDICKDINEAVNFSKFANLLKDAAAKADAELTDKWSAHSNGSPSHCSDSLASFVYCVHQKAIDRSTIDLSDIEYDQHIG